MKWNQLPYEMPEYDESQDTLIRQSTIGQMQLCPGRVKWVDHPEYLGMLSEPLVFGTCVHEIIANHLLEGKLQEKMLLSMDVWIEQLLVDDYDWSLKKVPLVRDFFSEIAVAYRSWVTHVLPTLDLSNIVTIEERQLMYLGEGNLGNIFLHGTADLVFSDLLMDWKTSGRAWKQVKADFSIQASLYMPLHKQTLDFSIQDFWFWIFNRQAGVWSVLKTKRTVAQIDAALSTALEYGRQIEAKAFPCTPVPEASFNKQRGWYCKPKFCSAWNVCDSKFMNDGINEKEIAVRSW